MLANDLKEYGKGYSYENLYRMSRFSNEFDESEIMSQPATQIPWFTIIVIMQKSKTHEEMLYSINETHKNGWGSFYGIKSNRIKII
jgi:predicted nuclease of restriction endonuclease-like (RecB) superfamily